MAKPKGDYANIFVPADLRDRIDALQQALGIKSRTDVVRVGAFVLENVVEAVSREWEGEQRVAGWVAHAILELQGEKGKE